LDQEQRSLPVGSALLAVRVDLDASDPSPDGPAAALRKDPEAFTICVGVEAGFLGDRTPVTESTAAAAAAAAALAAAEARGGVGGGFNLTAPATREEPQCVSLAAAAQAGRLQDL
jgi:hypothetical protein